MALNPLGNRITLAHVSYLSISSMKYELMNDYGLKSSQK